MVLQNKINDSILRYTTLAPAALNTGGPTLINASFANAFSSANSAGTVDLYTCPAGKRAVQIGNWFVSTNGSTATITLNIKSGGNYYPISTALSTTGAGNTATPASFPFVLEAGESYSYVSTGSGSVNYWTTVIEFDAATPFFTARNLAVSNSGIQTIYTCTTGKTGFALSNLTIKNNTGSSITSSQFYNVPNGGSPGASNQMLGTVATITSGSNSSVSSISFNSGDSFRVDVTTAVNNSVVAWVTVMEV